MVSLLGAPLTAALAKLTPTKLITTMAITTYFIVVSLTRYSPGAGM